MSQYHYPHLDLYISHFDPDIRLLRDPDDNSWMTVNRNRQVLSTLTPAEGRAWLLANGYRV
jgi:hypothetical protein